MAGPASAERKAKAQSAEEWVNRQASQAVHSSLAGAALPTEQMRPTL